MMINSGNFAEKKRQAIIQASILLSTLKSMSVCFEEEIEKSIAANDGVNRLEDAIRQVNKLTLIHESYVINQMIVEIETAIDYLLIYSLRG